MSKKSKRKPITTSKPAPPICRFKAGMPCFEIAKLQEENKKLCITLKEAGNFAETYKRRYHTMLDKASLLALKTSELRALKDEAESRIISIKKELKYYYRSFYVMRIINIIFTVGFAVMTAILIWR